MLFSYLKLKEIAGLDQSVTIEDVSKAINSIGFEVESISNFQNVEGIKFGHVLKTYKNPEGDNLTVCEVQFNDKVRIIQTAAKNVVDGAYLMAFVPGSKLKGITLEAKKMKGIVSEGMMVSFAELIPNDTLAREEHKNGILLIDKIDLNLDPVKYYKLDDQIIDIKILTNRSDANSYLVMAQELRAYFQVNQKLENDSKKYDLNKSLKVTKNDIENFVLLKTKDQFEITIEEQILLAKNNIKSINDIVDLTNLSLIMTGMPTHVYYEKDLQNVSISNSNDKVEILGNKEVKLENTLAIKNNDDVISLAGVMGIEKFSVKESKGHNYIFEFGIFDNKAIRKSMNTIKLESNAGRQSAKEISKGTMNLAINFVANKFNNDVLVSENLELKNKSLKFKIEDVYYYLSDNQKYDFKDAIKALEILGFEFKNDEVIIPTYRHDIENIQDMVEEILRFYGYEKIVANAPKVAPFSIQEDIDNFLDVVPSLGYQEVKTYSLISKEKNIFNPFKFEKEMVLQTFVSKEREVVRNSLINSFLGVIDYNIKRKMDNISIYEIGIVNNSNRVMALASNQYSFLKLKNDLIRIFRNYDLVFEHQNDVLDFAHKTENLIIKSNNKVVGYIARLDASVSEYDVVITEILIDEITPKKYSKNSFDLSKQLKVYDVNFELELNQNSKVIETKITALDKIFDYKIISEFEKEGKKIITVRIYSEEDYSSLLLKTN
ncbi:phenylalanine--tRNA ligase subunit beta [Mycoplasmopsis agassizii]|uniref:phenylalanine--tRNA ligase subunit beta n=1 Tax=Mycoplasmopsis agassizii TaxID=33922 RepID=UPI003529AD8F